MRKKVGKRAAKRVLKKAPKKTVKTVKTVKKVKKVKKGSKSSRDSVKTIKKVVRSPKVQKPKKSSIKSKAEIFNETEVDVSNVKTYKFLGYCPKCNGMVGDADLVSKFIFKCGCGKRGRTKLLKVEKDTIERAKSKREYLQNFRNFEFSGGHEGLRVQTHSALGNSFGDIPEDDDD